tara:strand:- start:228 stop:1367 length:1140 start_codon:yes stop_codon:yes gene_type:complete
MTTKKFADGIMMGHSEKSKSYLDQGISICSVTEGSTTILNTQPVRFTTEDPKYSSSNQWEKIPPWIIDAVPNQGQDESQSYLRKINDIYDSRLVRTHIKGMYIDSERKKVRTHDLKNSRWLGVAYAAGLDPVVLVACHEKHCQAAKANTKLETNKVCKKYKDELLKAVKKLQKILKLETQEEKRARESTDDRFHEEPSISKTLSITEILAIDLKNPTIDFVALMSTSKRLAFQKDFEDAKNQAELAKVVKETKINRFTVTEIKKVKDDLTKESPTLGSGESDVTSIVDEMWADFLYQKFNYYTKQPNASFADKLEQWKHLSRLYTKYRVGHLEMHIFQLKLLEVQSSVISCFFLPRDIKKADEIFTQVQSKQQHFAIAT